MKFYPTDWQSDQALRMCSLAARGLWVEMIAVMHRAEPYGHLLVNGRPPTDTQLAVLAGALPDQIPALLGELESAGVFSRTQKGVIYSRRMTRDDKRARIARKNGQRGGNPTLSSEREKAAQDNPEVIPADNTQKPEARSQKPESEKEEPVGSSKKRGSRLPEGFVVPPEWIEEARLARAKASYPPANLEAECLKFTNHWPAQPGQKGVKLDWHRTWINWALNARAVDVRPGKPSDPGNYGLRPQWEGPRARAPKILRRADG